LQIEQKHIEGIQKGDRKIILEVYSASFSVLMSVAVRYFKNDEDQKSIVNNAFLKIVQNIDKYKIGTAYYSWIKRIVRNEVIDTYRKNKNYQNLFQLDSELVEIPEESDFVDDIGIEASILQEALNLLPPATKLVFNLYAIDELSSKEICSELNIGYETVKWHIKEARKRLRVELENNKQYAAYFEKR
jgi:RNA polymerase sigma factor (sigma-70 family)